MAIFRLLLANRNLRVFWIGQFTSRLGTFLSYVATPLLVYQMTGATTPVALAALSAAVPGLLVGLYAGAVVDRAGKRRVMIVTDLLRAAATLALPVLWWMHALQLWHIYCLTALTAVGTAFFGPAELAMVPDLVAPQDLDTGNAAARSTEQLGGLAGPVLGAALFAAWGPAVAFLADAASFLVSAISLALISRPSDASAVSAPTSSVGQDIREGLRLVWQSAPLKAILICAVAVNLAFFPLPVLLPAMVRGGFLNLWGLSPDFVFGLCLSCLTAGQLAAALTITWFRRITRLRQYLHWTNFAIAAGLVVAGLSSRLGAVLAALGLVGYAGSLGEMKILTYVQSVVDGRRLGRVFSVLMYVAFGAAPLSIALAGPLADRWGGRWVLAGLGGFLLLASAVIMGARLLEGAPEAAGARPEEGADGTPPPRFPG